jgi:hypothetical protein
LTNDPGIDVSPACGPSGQIAFISTRHGGPQVFLMSSSGGDGKRITYKGEYNQTPAFCTDPDNPKRLSANTERRYVSLWNNHVSDTFKGMRVADVRDYHIATEIRAMRKRGHGEAQIRRIVYENPLAFFRQSRNFSFAPPDGEPKLDTNETPENAANGSDYRGTHFNVRAKG